MRRDAEEQKLGGWGVLAGTEILQRVGVCWNKRVLCPVALLDKQCFDWRGPLQAVDALTALR